MPDHPFASASDSDFDRIEATLASTASGRAFLAERDRRSRLKETTLLLDAMARLERRTVGEYGYSREELFSLVAQAENAAGEIVLALRGSIASASRDAEPGGSLDALGREITSSISIAVELVQDTAWRMREAGFESEVCDRLDEQASAIIAACRRQGRLLDGLSTVERSTGRLQACLAELRTSVAPPAAVPIAVAAGDEAIALSGSEIEFGPRMTDDEGRTG